MGLRIRLFLLVLIAVLPALVIQISTQVDLRRGREDELHEQALRQATTVATGVLEILEGSRQLLVALSRLPTVQSLSSEGCSQVLGAMLSELTAYATVGAIDRNGSLVCDASGATAGATRQDRTYFRDALLTNGFVVGEFLVGPTTGLSVLPVAQPIYRGQETVGVLFAGLNLRWLESHLRRQRPPGGSVVMIVDRGGTILASLPEGHGRWVGYQLPDAHRPYIFGDRGQSAELVDLDGVDRIFAYVPINYPPPGFAVAVGLNMSDALAPIETAMVRGLALILTGLLLGLIGAWLLGRYFVGRPLAALLDATRRWQIGDFAARAGLDEKSAELGQLGRAFDEMAERLQLQLKQKDLLLREVNHRVMNSLQLLSSVLALQRRRIADPAAREQFEQARRRIQSLALVHRRLYRHDVTSKVDIGRFLDELCREIVSTFASPERPIPLDVVTDNPEVTTDKVIPLALITYELLTNALKYARPKDGERRLRVIACQSDGALVVSVADNGPGLPPDVEQRAGLGMKLVQTLCLQLHGSLETSTGPEGTKISVIVPNTKPEASAAQAGAAA
ncbi:MAG TPA: cache domain-containing protein [Alphaproteobacteria bacterium]|nr:cache domain-containing protein [Alphaproteobacteria bacterium]